MATRSLVCYLLAAWSQRIYLALHRHASPSTSIHFICHSTNTLHTNINALAEAQKKPTKSERWQFAALSAEVQPHTALAESRNAYMHHQVAHRYTLVRAVFLSGRMECTLSVISIARTHTHTHLCASTLRLALCNSLSASCAVEFAALPEVCLLSVWFSFVYLLFATAFCTIHFFYWLAHYIYFFVSHFYSLVTFGCVCVCGVGQQAAWPLCRRLMNFGAVCLLLYFVFDFVCFFCLYVFFCLWIWLFFNFLLFIFCFICHMYICDSVANGVEIIIVCFFDVFIPKLFVYENRYIYNNECWTHPKNSPRYM